MRSNDAALERGSAGPRLFKAILAGLGGLLAAALFSGASDGVLPKPARAEAAASAMPGARGGPARAPGLCFHGPGGELLGFAPAGQHCR